MLETSKKQLSDDLKQYKIKEQELADQLDKAKKDKEEALKEKKAAQERMQTEIRQREKLMLENSQMMKQFNALSAGAHAAGGQMSYDQLMVKCKELENDNIIMKCQMKPVVVYNKESGTFEYIGQPIPLLNEEGVQQGEIGDIEEFLFCLKRWLSRSENSSLTVRTIFESLDLQNFGELQETKFETALHKIGVDLRPKEKRMLKDVLDPKNIGFLKYRSLLREL